VKLRRLLKFRCIALVTNNSFSGLKGFRPDSKPKLLGGIGKVYQGLSSSLGVWGMRRRAEARRASDLCSIPYAMSCQRAISLLERFPHGLSVGEARLVLCLVNRHGAVVQVLDKRDCCLKLDQVVMPLAAEARGAPK